MKTASEAEIKTAYRRLVLEHHPEKQGGPIKFGAVAEAHHVLGDPARGSSWRINVSRATDGTRTRNSQYHKLELYH